MLSGACATEPVLLLSALLLWPMGAAIPHFTDEDDMASGAHRTKGKSSGLVLLASTGSVLALAQSLEANPGGALLLLPPPPTTAPAVWSREPQAFSSPPACSWERGGAAFQQLGREPHSQPASSSHQPRPPLKMPIPHPHPPP